MPEAAEMAELIAPLQPSHPPLHRESGTAQTASEKGTISCQFVLIVSFSVYKYSLFTHTLLFLALCAFSLFTGCRISIFHTCALGLVLITLFIDPEALDFVMVLIYFP